MNLKPLLLACSLYCTLTAAAYAADAAQVPDGSQREAFCKNNPATCEAAQEKHEARRHWCEKNPEKCQSLKDEHKQRVQKMKDKCEANPQECEKKKAEFAERMKERRERRQQQQP